MPQKTTDSAERIKLLISFLDEENEEIIQNIEKELLCLNPDENNMLISEIQETDIYLIKERIYYISKQNQLRFFEDSIIEWINSDKRIYELLCIIAKLEGPALNREALDKFYDKMLKEVWLKIEDESSALEVIQTVVTFLKKNFEWPFFDKDEVGHMLINKVLSSFKFCPPMLDFLFLAMLQDLHIPVKTLKYEKQTRNAYFKFLIFAFENKEPYNISFFEQPILFYILPQTLFPIPEIELIKRYDLPIEKLKLAEFSPGELVAVFLRKLAHLYRQEKNLIYAEKMESLTQKIKNVY